MWTVIYMSNEKAEVLKVQELLDKANLAVKVRPLAGGDGSYIEILVPETEAQIAHEILIKNGY